MRGAAMLIVAVLVSTDPEAAETISLSLDRAIERARAHAPSLERLAALERAADAGVSEARAGRLPSVAVAAGYTRTSNVSELAVPIPGGGSRTIFPNVPDNWRARLGASVPLYTGGRWDALAASARAAREAAAGDAAAGDADLVLETTTAYWILATARERVRVLREGFAAYDQHFADARHREELGLAPRSDALLVEVTRGRAALALTRAVHDVDVAEEDLRRLVGIAPGIDVELADPLGAPAAPEANAEPLVAQALANRPERGALAARRLARESSARVEDAARRPRVTAGAGYDYARPNREILPVEDAWRGTWDVAIAATFEVFDGGRAKAAAARARAEADAAGRSLDEFDARLRVEVVARHRELLSSHEAIRVAERAVEAAAEARRIVRDRYLEGVSTNGDRLDAEAAWLEAGLDRTEAFARSRLAAAALDRTVGR